MLPRCACARSVPCVWRLVDLSQNGCARSVPAMCLQRACGKRCKTLCFSTLQGPSVPKGVEFYFSRCCPEVPVPAVCPAFGGSSISAKMGVPAVCSQFACSALAANVAKPYVFQHCRGQACPKVLSFTSGGVAQRCLCPQHALLLAVRRFQPKWVCPRCARNVPAE